MARDVAAKPGIEREHQALLDERYDLGDHPAQGVTMERGKPLQEGVRVKLAWSAEASSRELFPGLSAVWSPPCQCRTISHLRAAQRGLGL